jgi:hypothetical protein
MRVTIAEAVSRSLANEKPLRFITAIEGKVTEDFCRGVPLWAPLLKLRAPLWAPLLKLGAPRGRRTS